MSLRKNESKKIGIKCYQEKQLKEKTKKNKKKNISNNSNIINNENNHENEDDNLLRNTYNISNDIFENNKDSSRNTSPMDYKNKNDDSSSINKLPNNEEKKCNLDIHSKENICDDCNDIESLNYEEEKHFCNVCFSFLYYKKYCFYELLRIYKSFSLLNSEENSLLTESIYCKLYKMYIAVLNNYFFILNILLPQISTNIIIHLLTFTFHKEDNDETEEYIINEIIDNLSVEEKESIDELYNFHGFDARILCKDDAMIILNEIKERLLYNKNDKNIYEELELVSDKNSYDNQRNENLIKNENSDIYNSKNNLYDKSGRLSNEKKNNLNEDNIYVGERDNIVIKKDDHSDIKEDDSNEKKKKKNASNNNKRNDLYEINIEEKESDVNKCDENYEHTTKEKSPNFIHDNLKKETKNIHNINEKEIKNKNNISISTTTNNETSDLITSYLSCIPNKNSSEEIYNGIFNKNVDEASNGTNVDNFKKDEKEKMSSSIKDEYSKFEQIPPGLRITNYYTPSLDDYSLMQNMSKVRSTLRQFVRDWTVEGTCERETAYNPILNSLKKYLPITDSYIPKILCPGSGLGRLPYEVAKLGYRSQGNEFSYFMLLASNYILNYYNEKNSLYIQPYCLSTSNRKSRDDHLKVIKLPDVNTYNKVVLNTEFSMCAGELIEVYYNEKEQFDGILTCFFLDTAKNIFAYIRTFANILKPNSLWSNIGPLLYHYAEMPNEMSIELSWDEIKLVISKWFSFLEINWIDNYYTTNFDSMMQVQYHCIFFNALRNNVPVDDI